MRLIELNPIALLAAGVFSICFSGLLVLLVFAPRRDCFFLRWYPLTRLLALMGAPFLLIIWPLVLVYRLMRSGPYSHLLGGKLVAMLAASPEIVQAYRDRYKSAKSIIASSLAGRSIVREPSLVFLGTTSLYGSEPTQYTRLHMPCEEVGGLPGDVLRYKFLGHTEGFGTFQFGDETVDALQTALAQSKRGQRVNSIFGEGSSPRMRKIREGLDLLGLPSDLLLRHGASRLVYGVALIRNLKRFLLGQDAKPDYLFSMANPTESSQRISTWWSTRWLAKRMQHPGILDKVASERLTYPIRHGARVPIQEEGLLPFENSSHLAE